jgi:hypothetical protein
MTRSSIATHAEVSAFIRTDPAFARCLAEVARRMGIGGFRPYQSATLGHDQRRLMLTGQGLDDVRQLLADQYELVVQFTLACWRELPGSDIPEQEWPAGEEPDEDDLDDEVEVLGYDPKMVFDALCDLLVLRTREPAALDGYLKSLRLPGIRAWRATLHRAYGIAIAKTR